MKIKKSNTPEREKVEPGSYPCRGIQIVDYGTQKATNPKYDDPRKISIAWQLVDEKTADGENVVVYRTFTLGVDEDGNPTVGVKSNLGKLLKAWLGIEVDADDGFDLDEILNQPGMLTIEHTDPKKDKEGRIFANVAGVTPMPKDAKTKKPMLVAKATEAVYSLYLDETFDQDVFDELPDFVKETIQKSPEYEALGTPEEEEEEEQKPAKKGKAAPTKAAPAKTKGRR